MSKLEKTNFDSKSPDLLTSSDNLSRSLPSGAATLRQKQAAFDQRTLADRRKTRLDLLFNPPITPLSNSSPVSRRATPLNRSRSGSIDHSEDDLRDQYNDFKPRNQQTRSRRPSFSSTTNPNQPADTGLLLQSCYSSIANLRDEVDLLRLRGQEALAKAEDLEDSNRVITSERNHLEQKLLHATQDLTASQMRVQSLSGEVDALDLEVDKLRRENFRLRKVAFRAEESQDRINELEDLLLKSNRHANMSENRSQKLKAQIEKIKKAHRKLQQTVKRQSVDANVYEKISWLKESNEKLREALNQVTTLSANPNSIQHQVTTLVGVVNELINANGRLKSDVMQYCDMISHYRTENSDMRAQVNQISTNFPNHSLPASPRANTLPRLKQSRRAGLDSSWTNSMFELNDDDQVNLLEELNLTGIVSSSDIKAANRLRHSSSFECHSSLHTRPEIDRRDSGIFSTNDPMRHLYDEEWISEPEEEEEGYTHALSSSRLQTPIPSYFNTQASVSGILSDIEENSVKNKKSSQSIIATEVKEDAPKIKVNMTSLDDGIVPPKPTSKKNLTEIKPSESDTPTRLLSPRSARFSVFNDPQPKGASQENGTLPRGKPLPIEPLAQVTSELLERLRGTEPKTLNRKLKRSFDIVELAPRSNDLITTVIQNIDLLTARYQNLSSELIPSQTDSPAHRVVFDCSEMDRQILQFQKLVAIIKDLLDEVANLRIAANHLALAFVDKLTHISQQPPEPQDPVLGAIPSTTRWSVALTPQLPPTPTLAQAMARKSERESNSTYHRLSQMFAPQTMDRAVTAPSQPITTSDSSQRLDVSFRGLPSTRRAELSSVSVDNLRKVNPMSVRNGVVNYTPYATITPHKIIGLAQFHPNIAPRPEIDEVDVEATSYPCVTPSASIDTLRKLANLHSPPLSSQDLEPNPKVVKLTSPPYSPTLPTATTLTGVATLTANRQFQVRHAYHPNLTRPHSTASFHFGTGLQSSPRHLPSTSTSTPKASSQVDLTAKARKPPTLRRTSPTQLPTRPTPKVTTVKTKSSKPILEPETESPNSTKYSRGRAHTLAQTSNPDIGASVKGVPTKSQPKTRARGITITSTHQ